MSETQYASFTCYLGDGEFDYVTLPMAEGRHPLELGNAVEHFRKLYPTRSWKMFSTDAEAERRMKELEAWAATL